MNAKDQLLNSAIELFATKGFDGVSIREVADHAKIHFASIRYHFGGKEDLYKACISKHGESRLISAQKYLDRAPDSAADMKLRLSFAIDDTFRIHSQNPSLSRLLLQEVEASSGKTDLILKKTMMAMTEVYIKFFKHCVKKDLIRSDLDPVFLTQSLMGIIHHYLRTENIRERMLAHSPLKNKDFRTELVDNIVKLYTQ